MYLAILVFRYFSVDISLMAIGCVDIFTGCRPRSRKNWNDGTAAGTVAYNKFSTDLQVLMYNDVLYLELNQRDPVNNKLYNGGVDALAYITGEYNTYIHVSFYRRPGHGDGRIRGRIKTAWRGEGRGDVLRRRWY